MKIKMYISIKKLLHVCRIRYIKLIQKTPLKGNLKNICKKKTCAHVIILGDVILATYITINDGSKC